MIAGDLGVSVVLPLHRKALVIEFEFEHCSFIVKYREVF